MNNCIKLTGLIKTPPVINPTAGYAITSSVSKIPVTSEEIVSITGGRNSTVFIPAPIPVVTHSKSEVQITIQNNLNPTASRTQNGSNSTAITVAALAGVIAILPMLLIGICGFFLFLSFYRKQKSNMIEAPQNQDTVTVATLQGEQIPMYTNSYYQKCSSLLAHDHEFSGPPSVYCNPEIYSEIKNDRGSCQYDDVIVNYYDVIPEDVKPSSCEKDSVSDNGQNIPMVSKELASECALPNENEN